MHFHLHGEGYLIATVMLAAWTFFWSLVFARALKYVLRQRLLERVLLDRLERLVTLAMAGHEDDLVLLRKVLDQQVHAGARTLVVAGRERVVEQQRQRARATRQVFAHGEPHRQVQLIPRAGRELRDRAAARRLL